MPKNLIEIIDNTGNTPVFGRSRTIYIPGPSTSSTETNGDGEQVLCSSINELTKAQQEHNWDATSLSYKLASYLITQYHFNIVYEGIGTQTTVPQTSWETLKYSSFDIDFITTGQFGYIDANARDVAATRKDCTYLVDHSNLIPTSVVEDTYTLLTDKTAPADWATATNTYFSKSSATYSRIASSSAPEWKANTYYYQVTLSENNIYYEVTNAEPENWKNIYTAYYTQTKAETYVAITGQSQSYAADKYYKKESKTTPVRYAQAVREQFNIFNDSTDDPLFTETNDQNSYCAGFTPWFYSDPKIITGITKDTPIPATFGYLFAYATSIKNNPFWFAAAGSDRGRIPELTSTVFNYSKLDIEVLQARASTAAVGLDETGDNVGIAINAIANVRPFGIIIDGNRTLRYNTQLEDGTGELKATSFLNIRNLVSLIARTASTAADRYKFDQNNSLLWTKFTSELIPILEEAVAGGGILGYSLIQETPKKKARLQAKLVIVPIEAVEDLKLTIELADSIQVSTEE